ncbi:Thioredoxin-like superfamily [Sesbania bispinosa]|nr:Thioredoxin-like superfamily [Sesbania bispinosa]
MNSPIPIPLLTTVVVIAIASLSFVPSSSSHSHWQILTKHNFSSQIRLHPHLLLLVTLPWSGESRSLMKDVSLVIADKPQEFGSLKLRVMHRNTEKMLADSIGAATSDETTVIYFHCSVSYKYRGRLAAKNILSSLHHYISLAPEEVPLKALNTPQDFRTLLDSTDEALVLVDFCGWTPKLIAKSKKNNGTENGFGMHGEGDHLVMGFSGENGRTPVSRGKTNKKVAEEGMCKAEHSINKGFCEAPLLGEFTSVNDGYLEGFKDRNLCVLHSCSFEEFERFHSFYVKFMNAVREFFLPPERHRFGLVSDRSMLSSLGVGDLGGSWFAVHYLAGCSSCSNILKEEDDLNYILQMSNNFVKELEGNGHDQEAILPANKPSVLLFVDRSSDSSETRGKSMEALKAFRVLAQQYHVVNQTGKMNDDNHEKVSIRDYRGVKSTSDLLRLKLSKTAQKIKLNKKVPSIMIINEGKQVSLDNVASDLQFSSLNEILGYLLQQKKDGKLSSLAKDLGFQLLSDDIDIRSANTQQQLHPEVQLNQISTETSQEGHTDTVMLDQQKPLKRPSIVTSEEMKSVQSEEFIADHELPSAKVMRSETDGSSDGNDYGEEQAHFLGFNGSFFYSDGNYQLLKRFTGGCRIPSLVIVDPFQQQHYVYSEVKSFNFASQYGFLSEFLNGTLLPYQQSEHVLRGQREATYPPFVNLDFHEVDSIPRITAHTFSELVIGFNLSNKENTSNAWNKDVLVLFSNSWCAFCQRMEMIVREVYRAIKSYVDMLKRGSQNMKGISDHENFDYVMMKLPVIYLLDCTLNDCDLILKSVDQREVYPALVLFPAEKKKTLLYKGDMAVIDIMKFVAEHGNNFHHLIREKVAVLWMSERVVRNQNLFDTLQMDIHEESLHTRNKYHGASGQDRMLDQMVRTNLMNSPVSNGLHEAFTRVVIGSVLIATEKLLGSQPFDGSKILIVAADRITGFQGLIINKHLQWSFLPKLEEGFEKLKEAPLSLGGPVVKTGMPFLSLARTVSINDLPEILPGIHFLDHLVTIRKIEELKAANQPVSDYWFFLGYSNWGWDQLYDEMAEGAWNLKSIYKAYGGNNIQHRVTYTTPVCVSLVFRYTKKMPVRRIKVVRLSA